MGKPKIIYRETAPTATSEGLDKLINKKVHYEFRSKKNWTQWVQKEERVSASSPGLLRVMNGIAQWIRAGF